MFFIFRLSILILLLTLPIQARSMILQSDSLIFDDVTFSHENGTEIVKNASFSMQYGEILGLSGESGSGKTTILELICGLRSPNNGCILVNKTNLELINLNSWQAKPNQIGYGYVIMSIFLI